jgi:RimJ/RimL family protein N-acetyltransferase
MGLALRSLSSKRGEGMPRLLGKTIMLREYRQDDLPEIRKWVNDVETVKYLSSRFWAPQTLLDTQQFLENMLQSSHSGCNFIIADLKDERYIGQLDLFRLNWKLRCGELGMVIGSAEERGCGVGTEALGLILGYAFQSLGLERVELEVDMGNHAAIRCYEKAGFVLEGVKRHAYFRDGAFCDLGMLSVLSGEWRQSTGEGNSE